MSEKLAQRAAEVSAAQRYSEVSAAQRFVAHRCDKTVKLAQRSAAYRSIHSTALRKFFVEKLAQRCVRQ